MSTWTSLPNLLTLMRIVLIPVFIIAFYLPFRWSHGLAATIFALASFTDWLDGYLARRLKQMSPFGAFLDPVADKLLVACSLLLLVGAKDMDYITIPAIVIVGREIVISALREWMAEIGRRASVTVSYIGKVKTTLQMFALFLLVAFTPTQSWWGVLGFILLYMAAILTIWSMIIYLTIAWPQLMAKAHVSSS
ncbi:CDP-diacylglycerol--glycerol-3-phosphate 3-phosphatidyltransferase [Legionella lansingensis]|uniref:CDP-diacylglycerol--glycerol-3-phosphate 3-phosphatidyltransferase n=1 Tax=Legionella lansingensis TaxID=45067 RepID=A0A0W0VKE4_9GAMM|nr:CDP-diacylglycerol--glycerol-3-phosphate 3-phosphatidyltransferase [Legionella lansingensis]KTD20560.1 CDP-diacylglycerol--glycerol-3-phosphate 3-phosphatidyltransferase [Legionella lansingensis]SNV47764.1 CDP-diacylglycerol--glycerol-3-phosphate 3-phosphatidyltransferase [Legionella lansingensis]